MPAEKNVGEPCAGKPLARFDAAAGGNQASRAHAAARPRRLPPTLPNEEHLEDALRRFGVVRAHLQDGVR